MILDYLNMFSQAQAVTATAPSTDVIDLGLLYTGNDVRDIGHGYPVEFIAGGFHCRGWRCSYRNDQSANLQYQRFRQCNHASADRCNRSC